MACRACLYKYLVNKRLASVIAHLIKKLLSQKLGEPTFLHFNYTPLNRWMILEFIS